MARPKTILWVDDEAESLEAHVMFLEESGYSVDRAANGDDALAILAGKSFGAILLDEQMPGRRGLELVGEIRDADPIVPIVMVTKSEAQDTLREAIGVELDDYLVKPVNPRQVLSVVTRLVEGPRIRQQQIARDFAQRFRELEERRISDLGWREWMELSVELSRWDVRLSEAREQDLRETLRTFTAGLWRPFGDFVQSKYPVWLEKPDDDRPPLSVDVGSEFLVPVLQRYESVLFIVVDCLRLDQWEVLKPSVAEMFDVEVSHYYSILPTATPYARNALFSGLYPLEIKDRYPEKWKSGDEGGLNAFEKEFLTEQLRELTGKNVPVRYHKITGSVANTTLLRKLPSYLGEKGVTALVFNFVDQLTHGRSENEILREVARDDVSFRNLTRTWFLDSSLMEVLRQASNRGIPVLLTTDHGSIICETPVSVFAKQDVSRNLRYKFGEDLNVDDPAGAVLVEDLPSWGLPAQRLGVRMILARGDRFFVYPTKRREYIGRYKGAFIHGGITPEEMIVPVALLSPRGP